MQLRFISPVLRIPWHCMNIIFILVCMMAARSTPAQKPPSQPAPAHKNGADFDSSSCSYTSPRRSVITLVPAVDFKQPEQWDNKRRTKMLPMGCAAVDGNVWSLGAADGAVTISPGAGLHTSVNLQQIKHWGYIVGYPEVLYGYKPFGSINTRQSPKLAMPVQVGSIPTVWAVANYSIAVPNPKLPVDFSYDLWVTQQLKPNNVQKGDVELMIWLYHRNLKPAGKLLASRRFTAPVWVDGKARNAVFDVYATDPNIKGHTSILLSFALRGDEAEGSLDGGISRAYLAVDLRAMLLQMVAVLSGEFGWNEQTMKAEYVNGVELGTEFAQLDNAATLDWTLDNYCLAMPAAVGGEAGNITWNEIRCDLKMPHGRHR